MVNGLVQKDANMSRTDALAKVLAENPQLYEQYRKETAVEV